MIECEWKHMLTETQYEVLLDFFKSNLKFRCEDYIQKNYYYDTRSMELHKKGITVRIRQKNGAFTGTVKKHFFDGISKEDDFHVDNIPDTLIYKNKILNLLGQLITHRTVIHIGKVMKICLDMNIYCGKVDYEMEIEFINEKLYQKYFVKTKTANKYERFVSARQKSSCKDN